MSIVYDLDQWDCSPVVGARNTGDAVESSGVEAKSFDVDADGLDAGDRRLRARGSQLRHSSKKLQRWSRRCPKVRLQTPTMMKFSSSSEYGCTSVAA
jgi:hypothetical protein